MLRDFNDVDDRFADYEPDPDNQPDRQCKQCGYGRHVECRDPRCTCCQEPDDEMCGCHLPPRPVNDHAAPES